MIRHTMAATARMVVAMVDIMVSVIAVAAEDTCRAVARFQAIAAVASATHQRDDIGWSGLLNNFLCRYGLSRYSLRGAKILNLALEFFNPAQRCQSIIRFPLSLGIFRSWALSSCALRAGASGRIPCHGGGSHAFWTRGIAEEHLPFLINAPKDLRVRDAMYKRKAGYQQADHAMSRAHWDTLFAAPRERSSR